MDSSTRRRALAALATLPLAPLAGCTDGGTGDGADDPDGSGAYDTTTTDDETPTDSTTDGASSDDTTTTAAGNLDLREANVTGVTVESTGGRSFRFDVTLLHDDEGEDGYANWWQVERLDGTQLGRRELLHPHGTQEFTRSETVEIPEGVDCVVVRGHDQTHGYGGRAMLVDLQAGTDTAVDQGSEPQSFADA